MLIFIAMLNPKTISAREIVRNYKNVFGLVKRTNQPAVVVTQNEPQVAIISMDDLHELEQLKQRQSTKALLGLVGLIPKGSGLPADLSKHQNEYTWD